VSNEINKAQLETLETKRQAIRNSMDKMGRIASSRISMLTVFPAIVVLPILGIQSARWVLLNDKIETQKAINQRALGVKC
jgi:hypothetical protein